MAVCVVAELVPPFPSFSPMHALTSQPNRGTHSLEEYVQMALLDGEAKLGAPRMMAETQQWLA